MQRVEVGNVLPRPDAVEGRHGGARRLKVEVADRVAQTLEEAAELPRVDVRAALDQRPALNLLPPMGEPLDGHLGDRRDPVLEELGDERSSAVQATHVVDGHLRKVLRTDGAAPRPMAQRVPVPDERRVGVELAPKRLELSLRLGAHLSNATGEVALDEQRVQVELAGSFVGLVDVEEKDSPGPLAASGEAVVEEGRFAQGGLLDARSLAHEERSHPVGLRPVPDVGGSLERRVRAARVE